MGIISSYIVPHPPITINEISRDRIDEVKPTVCAYDIVASQIAKARPDTIIVITPHTTIFGDYFSISPGDSAYGSFADYDAPEVEFNVEYDKELAEQISGECITNHMHAGGMGSPKPQLDHGTMVPLYHINKYYTDFKLVRISISDYSPFVHYQFGKYIANACENLDRRVILIASGDLSHYVDVNGPYGYRNEGPIFDETFLDILKSTSFIEALAYDPSFIAKAGTCALKPFAVLAGAYDGYEVTSKLMSYQSNLGVGYAVCGFRPHYTLSKIHDREFERIFREKIITELNERNLIENSYVRLARLTLESLVLQNSFLTISDIAKTVDIDMLTKTAGAFVSIKLNGVIRGCIGTVIPTTDCIAHEIVNNAINAGYNDPRFNPISIDELPYLTYSVDILEPPEPIDSIDELDVNKYGVIVTTETKRGLLLPNLESIKTPSEQVAVAMKKAGISEHEHYNLERFEVIRYS